MLYTSLQSLQCPTLSKQKVVAYVSAKDFASKARRRNRSATGRKTQIVKEVGRCADLATMVSLCIYVPTPNEIFLLPINFLGHL